MDPSRNHRLIHVINNFEGPAQYKYILIFLFLYFDFMFIKLLINTREKHDNCMKSCPISFDYKRLDVPLIHRH